MSAWRDWYHVIGSTYGAWLPGDPRGWRSRRHKEHVEGDYKNPPPPGMYEGLHAHARASLRGDAVQLDPPARCSAGRALVERLTQRGAQILALSVSAVHFHFLARFCAIDVESITGLAKKHASHILRESGFLGTVWAKRRKIVAIRDRAHQVHVFSYICDHATEGAWIWTYKEGIYWTPHEPEAPNAPGP